MFESLTKLHLFQSAKADPIDNSRGANLAGELLVADSVNARRYSRIANRDSSVLIEPTWFIR